MAKMDKGDLQFHLFIQVTILKKCKVRLQMNLRGLLVLSYKTIPIHRGAICNLGIWVYWCDAIQLHILWTWLVKFHVSNVETRILQQN